MQLGAGQKVQGEGWPAGLERGERGLGWLDAGHRGKFILRHGYLTAIPPSLQIEDTTPHTPEGTSLCLSGDFVGVRPCPLEIGRPTCASTLGAASQCRPTV
jgi:hypothetical protein